MSNISTPDRTKDDETNRDQVPTRSEASVFSIIASAIQIVAFFLPWVKHCGHEVSAYDIASTENYAEDPWLFWAALVGPILIFLLFLFFKGNTKKSRKNIAGWRLIFGFLGTLPAISIIINIVKDQHPAVILYGLWLNIGGFVLILITTIADLISANHLEVSEPPAGIAAQQDRTKKIVVTGVLSAITIFLGITRLGFIPWPTGTSLTIMHVPAIIGAVLEGPIVGFVIGLLFGVFSLVQAAVAPPTPGDAIFINPLISILPRLFIGPISWLIFRSLKQKKTLALIAAGIVGSLTNTLLVLGVIGFLAWIASGLFPWEAILLLIVGNGLAEAVASAILVLAVVRVWLQVESKDDDKKSEF